MAGNEKSYEEFAGVHNSILAILQVQTTAPAHLAMYGHKLVTWQEKSQASQTCVSIIHAQVVTVRAFANSRHQVLCL